MFLTLIYFVAAKEGAGAVDEEDFIKAFDDVPMVQVRLLESTSRTKTFFKCHF